MEGSSGCITGLRLERCRLDQEEVVSQRSILNFPITMVTLFIEYIPLARHCSRPLETLTFFILATTPLSWDYCYLHSAGEETKVPRG